MKLATAERKTHSSDAGGYTELCPTRQPRGKEYPNVFMRSSWNISCTLVQSLWQRAGDRRTMMIIHVHNIEIAYVQLI